MVNALHTFGYTNFADKNVFRPDSTGQRVPHNTTLTIPAFSLMSWMACWIWPGLPRMLNTFSPGLGPGARCSSTCAPDCWLICRIVSPPATAQGIGGTCLEIAAMRHQVGWGGTVVRSTIKLYSWSTSSGSVSESSLYCCTGRHPDLMAYQSGL